MRDGKIEIERKRKIVEKGNWVIEKEEEEEGEKEREGEEKEGEGGLKRELKKEIEVLKVFRTGVKKLRALLWVKKV